MISKVFRLKTKDFKSLIETKKYYTEHFTIRVSKQNGPQSRFAVIAPKKLYKKAYLRNKAKRCVYNVLKNYNPGIDKVFIFITKDIINTEKSLILKEIKDILG